MKRALVLLLLASAGIADAQLPAPGTVARPRDTGRTPTIVPDRFLRSWDPLTIFFTRDVGASRGTPEDHPERYLTLTPSHPGAFTWIDERTLQFRPADPWSPLQRYSIAVGAHSFVLHTLMSPPSSTIPPANATGLPPIEAITLVYRDPIAAEDLERMVTIELRSLPGLEQDQARWLTHEDFEVKTQERAASDDPATFVLTLATPIPFGTRVTVHHRLSLDDASDRSFAEVSFATGEPFRVTTAGTRSTRFPITPGGSRYTAEEAINAGDDERTLVVEFSAEPRIIDPIQARNLVRLSPAVDGLSYATVGRTLEVTGEFAWDTLYRLTIDTSPILDTQGRSLQLDGASEVFLFFPRRPPYLRLAKGHGIVERYGPQMVPLEGRGFDRFDLRLYPVDPLDRSFWPFPTSPVTLDETARPPGPGETPDPFTAPRHPSPKEIAAHLATLGSPPVSSLVELPLRANGDAASFGLDLRPHLQRLAAPTAPGHYLVGLRPLDVSSSRQWMRLQVTDLSLSTIRLDGRARLVVTSLSTAQPLPGVAIELQGSSWRRGATSWKTLAAGMTDAAGAWETGTFCNCDCSLLRIVARKDDDVLVLDATQPPLAFADNSWFDDSYDNWLHSCASPPPAEYVSHVFTERPVYRPSEPVHIKGYLRARSGGRLLPVHATHTFVVVEGPGDLEWRYPVELTAEGSFHHGFQADDRPTGSYTAYLEGREQDQLIVTRRVGFRLEAYRIPRFEVHLHGPDTTGLDHELELSLTAEYYAGGRVAERPVAWRVTQFPYTWQPRQRAGYLYSSDARFSGQERFEARAALTSKDITDEQGSAVLTLDPTLEPTAQPRTYVVEATVTGADDQTVTTTKRVVALPPFILGVKMARYLEQATSLHPEIIVVGTDDQLLPGQEVMVRLKHRQWHSYLRASDFSDGQARYLTDVVDKQVLEQTITSSSEPLVLDLPIDAAGVWVVELEAQDRLGRAQTIAVDCYAGGEEPVTWSKPSSKVLNVNLDQDAYAPGEVASFVLESPFQTAEVLAVVEAPDGNRYHWLPVRGGGATFRLPVLGTWTPRLPVHFVLMRGRLPGSEPLPGSVTDLGKPVTLAATSWVTVTPRDNRVEVDLEHPDRALPSATVEITISLHDPDGAPLAGEVTLWLVDQAVLALGREQRLDPLPDFITPVASRLLLRDTRELAFGFLPFAENPGGGEGEMAKTGLMDRVTVRRNFTPVPFYDPRILIGPEGRRTVEVRLPDNLTNFMIRAKAVSGDDRFGFAVGRLSVRLPLIVQPALPRFVRPGDSFTATAIGRLVEGESGPGTAEIAVIGAEVTDPVRREVVWVPDQPRRLEFAVEVPTPEYDDEGRSTADEVVFKVAVERLSDGASDAFEVTLPIRDDRRQEVRRLLTELSPGEPVVLPVVEGEARPGTARHSVLVSSQAALVRMAAGLSFLLEYPYGCTEQRLSRARALIALERFRDALAQESTADQYRQQVVDALTWISQVVDDNGLVAYWPGSRGYVCLTAWSLQLLAEARDAGFVVDTATVSTLVHSLEQALRSDYSLFIDGESFAERCWALTALARAGRFNPAYAAELARHASFLDLEATAQVLQSFVAAEQGAGSTPRELAARLWDGVVIRLYQGKERYGGLQDRPSPANGLILASETRTLAELTRALARLDQDDDRLQLLVDGLVTLGGNNGWGSTNANAAALLALAEVLASPSAAPQQLAVAVSCDSTSSELTLDSQHRAASLVSTGCAAGTVTLVTESPTAPVVVRAETRWMPADPGSMVAAQSHGFVVERELLHIVGGGAPPRRLPLTEADQRVQLRVGDVIEEHVRLVNPAERHFVAVVVPLAAGMEPLNPELATAPPEARPTGTLTLSPTATSYLDDHVAFYYNTLPKGTFEFFFRTRATTVGSFIQPAAIAEMMYDEAVRGNGCGASLTVVAADREQ